MTDLWRAKYLDGRSAARRPATVRLTPVVLEVALTDGRTFRWRLVDVRPAPRFSSDEPLRLEWAGGHETVVVDDPAFAAALAAARTRVRRGTSALVRRRRAPTIFLAAAGIVALGTALYLWGIPAAGRAAASVIPRAWEARLGAAVVEQIAPPSRRCVNPDAAKAVDAILARLLAPAGRLPYVFTVLVLDDPGVNALATPGGRIVVFRGLLENARTPDELAGVLAHEVQHVLHRHATRAVLERASLGFLRSALAGDLGSGVAHVLAGAERLGVLRYSRQAETEADVEGLRTLLAAGVDPRGMIDFFGRLAAAEGPGAASYLDTHPDAAERAETLWRLAGTPAPTTPSLVSPEVWDTVRRFCG